MARNTIIVTVLGNTRGLSRALDRANTQLGGLQRISEGLTSGLRTAGIALGGFGAAAVAGAAVGAAALAGIPALVAGIGIAFAAQNEQVKGAFSDTVNYIKTTGQGLATPLIQPLVEGAGHVRAAWDVLVPVFRDLFAASAPLVDYVFKQLVPLAEQLGPLLRNAFAAGTPVLFAFINGLQPLIAGISGFYAELGKGSPQFTGFITAFMSAIGQMLPALGRLLVALAPVGTQVLSLLVPAFNGLVNILISTVIPAFSAVVSFIQQHTEGFGRLAIAIVAVIGVVQGLAFIGSIIGAIGTAVGVVTTVFRAFQFVIVAVRSAFILLNIAMALNPIGLVIAAIVALVAIFVIAWTQSETFRNIVIGAWEAIRNAAISVWNFVGSLISSVVTFIGGVITAYFNMYRAVILAVWGAIQGATSGAWNAIRGVVTSVAGAISGAVSGSFNAIRSVISSVWSAAQSLTSGAWNAIRGAVSAGVSGVVGVVSGLAGSIVGALGGLAGTLTGIGRNIIAGLIGGIRSMAGAAASAAKDAVMGAVNAAKGALGIHSPSTVFRDIGINTVKGLELGLEKTAGVKAATVRMAETITGNFAPELSLSGAGMAGGVGNVYNINVSSLDPNQSGRLVMEAIKSYETQNGQGWRR